MDMMYANFWLADPVFYDSPSRVRVDASDLAGSDSSTACTASLTHWRTSAAARMPSPYSKRCRMPHWIPLQPTFSTASWVPGGLLRYLVAVTAHQVRHGQPLTPGESTMIAKRRRTLGLYSGKVDYRRPNRAD
jgi:hypothetical protein